MEKAVSDNANKELSVTRLLSVPVEQVWEMWTKPAHIVNWWGPDGFTNTISKMDLVPEGEWRLTMHGPDGKNYPNKSIFKELVPLKKIVFQHFNPNYLAVITFEAEGRQTQLAWRMQFDTSELFETVVRVFKADEGLYQNVEKLEKYLKQNVQ